MPGQPGLWAWEDGGSLQRRGREAGHVPNTDTHCGATYNGKDLEAAQQCCPKKQG